MEGTAMKRWIFTLFVATAISSVASATEISPESTILEDLADHIVTASLTEDDAALLEDLTPEEIEEVNVILAEISNDGVTDSLFDSEESYLPDAGPTPQCENIFGWSLAGYSYVRPYYYWLRPEWNGSDLMLEYAFNPPDCSSNHPKAFYITNSDLYRTLSSCGIAVQRDAMEGCTRRVTAVIGFSKYWRFGPGTTANNTLLGFRLK